MQWASGEGRFILITHGWGGGPLTRPPVATPSSIQRLHSPVFEHGALLLDLSVKLVNEQPILNFEFINHALIVLLVLLERLCLLLPVRGV